jgi:hypothetical protein
MLRMQLGKLPKFLGDVEKSLRDIFYVTTPSTINPV